MSSVTKKNQGDSTPEPLSRIWDVILSYAMQMYTATNHDCIRLSNSSGRRVKTMAHQNAYKQLAGYLSRFSFEAFKVKVSLIRGNIVSSCFVLDETLQLESIWLKIAMHQNHWTS